MRALNSLLALFSLALTIALLPVPGGAIFAPFTFGLFLLALGGVMSGLDDHDVRPRRTTMDPSGWRDSGSQGC
jgi:hypothetical protein